MVLRGEPHGKGRPRSRIAKTKTGQSFIAVYTPVETRAYEKALAWAGRAAMKGSTPIEGPIQVHITAVFGVPASWSSKKRDSALAGVVRPTGRPDFDNLAKGIDALNGIIWRDDSQIVDARVLKIYGEEPLLRIEVRSCDEGLLA